MEISAKHKIFANEVIRGKTATEAYSIAYPNAKPTSCRVESYKILQKPTISEYIKIETDKIKELATIEAVTELKDKMVVLLSDAEQKKQILADIYNGKLLYKTYEPVYDEDSDTWATKPLTIAEPSLDTRIKAIQAHNLMTGDNAPTKVANTTFDGQDVKQVIIINGKEIEF